MDFIDWFITQIKLEKCNAISFMGDWFENRNAINVQTLNQSFIGLEKLDALGIPIYFCVGNHDLYHRENRGQFSTFHLGKFKNVILVNDVISVGDMMFAPYLFKNEYTKLAADIAEKKPKYVFGHFEFRNFVITGTDRKMEHGPDHTQFAGPTYIFSGHFHKRQANDNIVYIGNTFPTNYGDQGDDERGMCILDTSNDKVEFINWDDCPKYRKVRLSNVLNGDIEFPNKCRVKCVVDIDIAYTDAQALKDEMVKGGGLREFILEENLSERKDAIAGQDGELEFDFSSINDAVTQMLKTGVTPTTNIDPDKLVEIYSSL
jgi:DNA repair exonuclease SbcCD nuclease subunit